MAINYIYLINEDIENRALEAVPNIGLSQFKSLTAVKVAK
jgi:hypothetical protein